MIILALDTTSEFGSVAIRCAGRTVAETAIHAPDGFAHVLFPAVNKILQDAGLTVADIDCFAAASGPGSFTGVRIGLSTIKGLAEATRRPVAGISNLRALSSFGRSHVRAVVLDARRGEVYAGIYTSDLEPVGGEVVSALDAWKRTLDPGLEYEFVFAGHPPRPLAAAVALCAELDYGKNRWLDAAELDANYVRRSDAELFRKND
ncbi:MAG: tRNA (adenosine(37)-N6)-threonylcarbamoyltransferase complex dimerization subunit type 1 TsaB [Acidobacteriaceae bacterium]|nr:tRNA (adenosine(37)-N6)-threonylcarbamoyltransferase complex dimerization subunit type 1 TsaB [Acidobacteriaceae bacterium]MBV8569344.1 tRNA (adenosine(37)-N6)-threonylcarbamoyltransferase complex dimerization subunit type 1 TsaB [Acidobacteriaceae bacterium]